MSKSVDARTEEFLKVSKDRSIKITSLASIDGLTAAAILAQTLRRLDKPFSITIFKEYTKDSLSKITAKNHLAIPLCLPKYLQDERAENDLVYLLENPTATTAESTYLFSRSISDQNKDLSKIALVSIIAQKPKIETAEINSQIIEDAGELTTKQGPTLCPATRPMRRALEYSTTHYIPGVTGNSNGVLKLLQEAEIEQDKTVLELTEEEISRLVSAVMHRRAKHGEQTNLLGNLYAIDLFNKKEDVREIAILLNSCAKLGHEDTAIAYCLGNEKARAKAFEVYTTYKQEIISGLKIAESLEKITGKGFVILNAKDKIKSELLGTLCSLLSNSYTYEEGTIIIAVAHKSETVQITARVTGSSSRNIKEILQNTIHSLSEVEVEVSGDKTKAKCTIDKTHEEPFLKALQKNLEVEVIKM